VGFLGDWLGGTSITHHYVREGRGQEITMALEAGIGEIRVASPDPDSGRCIGCFCAWWASCGYELMPEEAH
jgi:hypothetical protein